MVPTALTFVLCLLLTPLALRADPEADVRNAVTALARTSHAWETTVRQRFSSETREPRLNPNAPIEVRGRTDPETFTEITQQPTRDLPVPVTALFRGGEVVPEVFEGFEAHRQPDEAVDDADGHFTARDELFRHQEFALRLEFYACGVDFSR
jgi:hypothetical protein